MNTSMSNHRSAMQRTLNRWLGLVFACGLTTAVVAQQDPQFTQYMFNMLALEPRLCGQCGPREPEGPDPPPVGGLRRGADHADAHHTQSGVA
jgi:hypothetical protein